jgi:hypothetical protein
MGCRPTDTPVLGDITGITATPAVTPGERRLITKKAGHRVTGLVS